MTRIAASLWLLTALVCATGCTQVRFEAGDPLACYAEQFIPDAMTDMDVMCALGPPMKMTRTSAGYAFLYEHIQTLENQFGLSLQTILKTLGFSGPAVTSSIAKGGDAALVGTATALIRFLYAWEEGELEALGMEFDPEGTLKAVAYAHDAVDLGSTFALSLIISAQPKVASEDFKGVMPQHAWGRSLLEWMPEVLNYPQDLSTGASGLKRLPEGHYVGQNITIPQPSESRREKKREARHGYRTP